MDTVVNDLVFMIFTFTFNFTEINQIRTFTDSCQCYPLDLGFTDIYTLPEYNIYFQLFTYLA